MPIKVPFQYLDGVGEPARSQLYRDFEEIQRFLDSLDLSAGSGRVGTTPTSLLRVGNTYVGSHPVHGVNQAPASNWAALGHWDKQGSADYAFMQNGDGRTLVNASAGQTVGLRIAGSAVATVNADNMDIMEARVGRAGYGNQYAAFGFGAAGVAQGTYGFMQSNVGYTFVNCANGQEVALRHNNANRLRVTTDRVISDVRFDANAQVYCTNWLRSQTAGTGWYSDAHGGGVYMTDSTWVRVYAGKGFLADNEIRALDAMMHRWTGSSGHGIAGNGAAGWGSGYMTRYDGYMWLMCPGAVTWRMAGGDIMSISNSGGWADLRANLATLAGTTMVITGVNQFGRSSSSRRYKTVLGELSRATTDEVGKPILDHANPFLTQVTPIRFHWNDKVGNWKEVNAKYPDGVAGFIAEDIAAVAPDAVQYDPDGQPINLDQNAMMAYIVGALQHTHRGGHKRLDRLNALEPQVAALEALVNKIAAIPVIRAALK